MIRTKTEEMKLVDLVPRERKQIPLDFRGIYYLFGEQVTFNVKKWIRRSRKQNKKL